MWLAADVTVMVGKACELAKQPQSGKRFSTIENDTHDVPLQRMLELQMQTKMGTKYRCMTF